LAHDWDIVEWLNTPDPITLPQLRGKAVFAVAFQMLCPGCVSHALPQAARVRQVFAPEDVAVIGLHTVFEHHEAQGGAAPLSAFLHEYRIGFPVGIDRADPGGVPVTMRRYAMQGTPTTLLIDREGQLRLQQFGHLDDIALGAAIARLLAGEPQLKRRAGARAPWRAGPAG
jgi:hypothetical protein